MIEKQQQTLILCGFKSAGKSYFGRLLSQELGLHFTDTDQLVEKLYEKEFCEKLNCKQISIKLGKAEFRSLETRVIDDLEQTANTIISLGGGAVLNPENCLKLKKLGTLIYLEVDKETVRQRIFSAGIPSFLDPNNPEKSFEMMYQERVPIYEKNSTFKVRVQGKTDQQILDELKAFLIPIP